MNKKPSKNKFRLTREEKLVIVLKPLAGKQRQAMENLLQTVPTSLLNSAYSEFVERVQKEVK